MFKKIILVISLLTAGSSVFAQQVVLENPLKHDTFGGLFSAVGTFVFWLALSLVPLMILIAAFQLFQAGGDPEKVKNAKNILKWTAIGLLIVLSARALYDVIKGIVDVEEEAATIIERSIVRNKK